MFTNLIRNKTHWNDAVAALLILKPCISRSDQIKSISTSQTDRQTDRRTDRQPLSVIICKTRIKSKVLQLVGSFCFSFFLDLANRQLLMTLHVFDYHLNLRISNETNARKRLLAQVLGLFEQSGLQCIKSKYFKLTERSVGCYMQNSSDFSSIQAPYCILLDFRTNIN